MTSRVRGAVRIGVRESRAAKGGPGGADGGRRGKGGDRGQGERERSAAGSAPGAAEWRRRPRLARARRTVRLARAGRVGCPARARRGARLARAGLADRRSAALGPGPRSHLGRDVRAARRYGRRAGARACGCLTSRPAAGLLKRSLEGAHPAVTLLERRRDGEGKGPPNQGPGSASWSKPTAPWYGPGTIGSGEPSAIGAELDLASDMARSGREEGGRLQSADPSWVVGAPARRAASRRVARVVADH